MKLKTLTVAALAATLSTAAFAQSASSVTEGGATSVGESITANAGANANANANANASGMSHGNLISELKNGSANSAEWSSQIAGLGEDATVNVVPLSELKGEAAENSAALEDEMGKVRSDAEMAQGAIEDNDHVRQALESRNYSSSDVVAVNVSGSNEVTLIVNDRM